jgi:hypothetical protein
VEESQSQPNAVSATERESSPEEKDKREIKPKDPVFKAMLVEYFQRLGLGDVFEVVAGKQVGQLQLEIDTAVVAKTAEVPTEKLENTPFWFLRRHSYVEFKGVNDALNEDNFARILGRAFLGHGDIPSEQKRQMVSCIISDAVPHKIFRVLADNGTPFEPVDSMPGYYFHKGILFPIYLICCNRLPIVPKNYPLLMFASGDHLTDYFEQLALDTGMEVFLKYIVRMYPKEGAKLYEKVGDRMTAEEQRYIADVLDKVLPPEEKLRLFSKYPELIMDYVDTMPVEEKTKLLEKELQNADLQSFVEIVSGAKKLSPEKIEALKKLLSDEN